MAEPLLPMPARWTPITLEPRPRAGYILRVDSGGTPPTHREEYWDGDIPWLTPKETAGCPEGLFVSHTARALTAGGLANSAAKLLPPGTVLLTKRAPVGAVAINAVPMATNQGFLNFRCGPKLRPLYLAYWLRANERYLNQVANGSTYRELYKGDLFEFEMAVPPEEEQDAILAAIGALQYVLHLGMPLEQSVASVAEMVRVQSQTRRLAQLRNALMVRLLSGEGGAIRSLLEPQKA